LTNRHARILPFLGRIEDIDAVEKENTKRIEKMELKNKDFLWLEEQLTSLNEELSRRAGILIPSKDKDDKDV
jgi:hypothetical protein